MNYEKTIRTILFECLSKSIVYEIDIETDIRTVGLTSVLFVKIIIEIEDFFSISFPDEKMILDETNTIKAFCEIVEKCEIEKQHNKRD